MSTYRVLLMEDDEDDAFFLTTIFKELYGDAVQVTCYPNPDECRRTLTPEERPDLLILDYYLPPVTALDLLEWIPSQPHLQSVKTLLWSSGVSEPELEACLRAGVNEFVPKALEYTTMKHTIKQLIDKWSINQ